MDSPKTQVSRGAPVALLLLAGIAVIGFAAWYFYLRKPPEPPKAPVLSAEARQYVREGRLQLSEVAMGAKESFGGARLVEITGKITNAGDRHVKLVEINCVFHDPYGLVVFRERVPIVGARTGGLKPGETKPFRLAFDSLPQSWNQALPQLVIAQIVFG
jgi:hypothetical protein